MNLYHQSLYLFIFLAASLGISLNAMEMNQKPAVLNIIATAQTVNIALLKQLLAMIPTFSMDNLLDARDAMNQMIRNENINTSNIALVAIINNTILSYMKFKQKDSIRFALPI